MKTLPEPRSSLPLRAALAASFLTGLVSTAFAAGLAAPKDHVLFVGTDLAVKQDGKYYHVIGATSDKLQIERNRGVKDLQSIRGAEIKISRGVKLSNRSATIDNLHTDSVDRAAAKAQFDAMQASMLMSSEAGDNEDRLHGNLIFAGAVAVSPGSGPGGAVTAELIKANVAKATEAYVGGLNGLDSLAASSTTFFTEKLTTSDTAEVEISFDVSSPQPIDNAYIVVVANYASPSGDKIARQVAARQLDRVDSRPRKVRLSHVASAAGLAFKKFDIGLFANGQEVATNLSEKRMDLTSDQAYQFFLIDYLSAHQGATAAPAPMLMAPRAEFRKQIASGETTLPIYATVAKSGAVVALSTDESGAGKVPASLEAALQNVRFMPALRNGEPVEGRIKLTLAELIN